MAVQLDVSKAVHRAGEHRAGDGLYREQLLIATHEEPLPVFTASGYGQPPQWGTTAGRLAVSADGSRATLTPPNAGQPVTVTAFDPSAGQGAQRTVMVYGTFPLAPAWDYEVKRVPRTKKSEGEDGSGAFRRRGAQELSWQVEMPRRELVEARLFEAFLDWHDIDVEFYWDDKGSGYGFRLVRFTSGMSRKVGNPQRHTITCTLQEIVEGESAFAE